MYQLSQEASSPLQCVLLAFKVLCFFFLGEVVALVVHVPLLRLVIAII